MHPSRTFRDTEYKHSGLNPLDSLNKIASAKNLGETLANFHPPHEQYKLLKAELAKPVERRKPSRSASRMAS